MARSTRGPGDDAALPTEQHCGTPAQSNYGNVPSPNVGRRKFDVRIDHNFSAKDSLFARFSYDQAVSFVPGGSQGSPNQAHLAARRTLLITDEILRYRKRISSLRQHQPAYLRLQSHFQSHQVIRRSDLQAAIIGILGADLNRSVQTGCRGWSHTIDDGLHQLRPDSSTLMENIGDSAIADSLHFRAGPTYSRSSDSFDMIRGNHNIRIGGKVRANQMNVDTNAFQDGFFIDTFSTQWRRLPPIFSWANWAAEFTIRPSSAPPLAGAGSFSVRTLRMIGESHPT